MKFRKLAVLAASIALASLAFAQDISIEEMMQLDKMRALYKEKGIELKAEDEVRMLQRIRAMKAASPQQQAPTGVPTPTPGAAMSAPNGGANGLMQMIQAAQQRAMGGSMPAAAPLALPAQGAVSEQEMGKRLAALPSGKSLFGVEVMPDGLKFDGQRFADPEGRAERFSVDADSATAGYLVRTGVGAMVKIARVGTGSEPLTIGQLIQQGNQQVFQSYTGKTLAGEMFFALTDGVLVMRDSVGFRYVVGEGVKQIDFPAGWYPTPVQRGNLSTTGWVLLERDNSEQKANPFNSLLKLGQIVGLGEAASDYALFNLNDRRMTKFEISADGKSVNSYSQCRRKNSMVNVCDQMKTFESAKNTDGSPNLGHYFWRILWERVQGKSVAVVMEKGLQQVNAYALNEDKKVNLFERGLGINGFQAAVGADGKYRVVANMAFDKVVIEDAFVELQRRSDARLPQIQGAAVAVGSGSVPNDQTGKPATP